MKKAAQVSNRRACKAEGYCAKICTKAELAAVLLGQPDAQHAFDLACGVPDKARVIRIAIINNGVRACSDPRRSLLNMKKRRGHLLYLRAGHCFGSCLRGRRASAFLRYRLGRWYCLNKPAMSAVFESPAWTTTRYSSVSFSSLARFSLSPSSQYIGVGEKNP